MRRYTITTLIWAVAVGIAFWLGYREGGNRVFWDGFRNELGMAHILRRAGLTQEGEKQFNKLSDIQLYGYFLSSKAGQSKEQKREIDRLLIDLMRWKRSKGYAIGPQEPLVGMKLQDGELKTEPVPKAFAICKARLDAFMKEHKESIQQAESTVPSKAAPGASSDAR